MMFLGIPDKEQATAIRERVKLHLQGKAEAAAYRALVAEGKATAVDVGRKCTVTIG